MSDEPSSSSATTTVSETAEAAMQTVGRPAAESILDSLRSFEDARLGIRETFLTPSIGGGRTIGILSEPTDRPRALGWVMCHSFGLEQINLQPVETQVARALASAGFPVFRFHAQGYGDSELPTEHVSRPSHMRDTLEATQVLRGRTSVEHVGLLGARFGGTIAALVADVTDVSAIALWDPLVKGKAWVQTLARLSIASNLLIDRDAAEPPADPLDVLRTKGQIDVQGFPLRIEVFDDIAGIDLLKDLTRFRGPSLVMQISRSTTPRPLLDRLVAHLGALGGDSRFEIAADKNADKLGQPRFQGTADGSKVDLQATLAESIVSRTVEWASTLPQWLTAHLGDPS